MEDKELRAAFMENLNYYLSLNGFSQADMARRMQVSTATAAKWCTGKTMPRIDKIQSLCNWFGIEKSDLLERPGAPAAELSLTDEEKEIVLAFRAADDFDRETVRRALGIRGKNIQSGQKEA